MTLKLRCNSLKNISKLSNLKKLSSIEIEKSRVSTIDFIKGMNVEYLKLENNIITDISPLKGFNSKKCIFNKQSCRSK